MAIEFASTLHYAIVEGICPCQVPATASNILLVGLPMARKVREIVDAKDAISPILSPILPLKRA